MGVSLWALGWNTKEVCKMRSFRRSKVSTPGKPDRQDENPLFSSVDGSRALTLTLTIAPNPDPDPNP